MINMVKAEMKRLFYSHGFWISIVIFAGLYVLSIGMQSVSQQTFDFSSNSSPAEPGIYLSVDTVVSSLNALVISFGHSFGLLVMGIYLAGFVSQEYSSGFVKNTVSLKHGRINMIMAKLVIAAEMSVFILLLSYIIGAFMGHLFISGFQIEAASALLSTSGVLMLVSIAFFSLIIFVSTFFRNKTSGIIMTFLICSGLHLALFQGILDAVHLAGLSRYFLSAILLNLADEIKNISCTTILISLAYIIVYNVLSICVIKHRDL